MPRRPTPLLHGTRTRFPILILLIVVVLVGAHVARRLRDPSIVLLIPEAGAQWLRLDAPGSLRIYQPGERNAVFRTHIKGVAQPTSTTLTVRALRRVAVLLNGQNVFDSGPDLSRWKVARVTPLQLPAGDSELTLVVSNEMGPPMVLAHADFGGGELQLASGPSWEASADGKSWAPAATADSPIQVAKPGTAMRPSAALVAFLPLIIPLALLGAAWGWREPAWVTPSRVRWALLAMWMVLALNNLPKLPVRMGFDMTAHLQYMDFIARNHRLPLANEGWQMFQSPLYYVLSAPLFAMLNGQVSNGVLMGILRLIPMACGAAQVELSYRAARYALPGRRVAQCLAILLGGLLPMTLYISQSVGNEPLSGCLGALGLVLAMRYARQPRARTDRSAATIGAVLGLAMLAKVTSVLMTPVFAWVVALRRRGVRRAIILLVTCGVVCGWYYLRNVIQFGRPFVAGWDPSRVPWWQDPGYRTIGSFTRFGQALVDPIYAGLNGFWDALYSTLWADGFLSGLVKESSRPPWNYEAMSAGMILSLLPTLAIVIGFVRAWRHPVLRIAAACLAIHFAALVDLYFQVPVYSTVKATYLQALTPALAVLVGAGVEPATSLQVPRAVLCAWLTAWAAMSYTAFFIVSP